MTKKTIYEETLLIATIMCDGCGSTINAILSDLDEFKKKGLLPEDAELIIDNEPHSLGLNQVKLFFVSRDTDFLDDQKKAKLKIALKDTLAEISHRVITEEKNEPVDDNSKINWINIAINITTILVIIILSLVFPPSLPLTICLSLFSILTTAFTARKYIYNSLHTLFSEISLLSMDTPITLGWILSVVHTLYHSIVMPLAKSFSMTFMNYIMPITLITIMNGMDEMKRVLSSKLKKIQLQGIHSLIPELSTEYPCYALSDENQHELLGMIERKVNKKKFHAKLQALLLDEHLIKKGKSFLKKGMVIKIQNGECFPVDGILLSPSTLADVTILSGEKFKTLLFSENIPAGAINLGQEVIFYVTKSSYDSSINQMLFRVNREQSETNKQEPFNLFPYIYTGLIILSLLTAIVVPFALGLFTIPLLLQNIMGILFAVCPCTLTIAHQLPSLLSHYQRTKKGLVLRNDTITTHTDEIHTIVFDKTGTLTTGDALVDGSEGINEALWQRIYLLEQNAGAGHPLAKAIIKHCEANGFTHSLINTIDSILPDQNKRGLSAVVQGKQLLIGNAPFLQEAGIMIPSALSSKFTNKLAQGHTAVYIAENGTYQGVILIKHELRKNITQTLRALKQQGKKLILLTGCSKEAAQGFNQSVDLVFETSDIHAEQKPTDKEAFVKTQMAASTRNPQGFWFIGDGFNDAACSRFVSEKGGVSCSITAKDKAAFFTDLSLDGTFDYLFQHEKLNVFLKKNTLQNQLTMLYSALIFLAFIVTFTVTGIALSPLIPLLIMVFTTLITLFNSYRVNLSGYQHLDKKPGWFRQCLTSDWSMVFLIAGCTLLVCSILITSVASGGLALPVIAFTAGVLATISSACVIGAIVFLGVFALLGIGYLCNKKWLANDSKQSDEQPTLISPRHDKDVSEINNHAPLLLFQPQENTLTEERAYKISSEISR